MLKSKLKKIVIFFTIFILVLICLEIYTQLSGLSLPSYAYDDIEVGRTHHAGYDIFLKGAEGFCIDEVNEFGYVGVAYPRERSTNSIRIAVLGSSYIEGLQVLRRNRFSSILEHELSKRLSQKIEVLNFAIGGDDFRGMYVRYQKIVKDFNPDYVLFMIQSQSLLHKKSIPSPDLIIEKDSLIINYDFLNNAESRLRQKFQILREFGIGNLIKEAFEVYYTGRLTSVILDRFYLPSKLNDGILVSDTSSAYYELNIKIMKSLHSKNENLNHINMIIEMNELPNIYSQFLDSLNLPRIELYKELNKFGTKDLLFWKASGKIGHWNNFAHRIVGETLANDLDLIIRYDFNNLNLLSKKLQQIKCFMKDYNVKNP